MPKPLNLISPHSWPARRPDGQTAAAQSDPVPSVKGSSKRPGTERIEARIPAQIGQKFKLLCALNHLEQRDVITELITAWNARMTGRPDGQTALYDLDDQERSDRLIDEEERRFTSSSNQLEGRPDGQPNGGDQGKRSGILAYYSALTGNPIKQNDLDFLASIDHFATHHIKGGIAQSILRCQTRINSLRYCYGAIEEMHDSGVDKSFAAYLEGVLEREEKWNPTITPIDERMIETMRRRRPPQQPALPGTSGDLVQLSREDS